MSDAAFMRKPSEVLTESQRKIYPVRKEVGAKRDTPEIKVKDPKLKDCLNPLFNVVVSARKNAEKSALF